MRALRRGAKALGLLLLLAAGALTALWLWPGLALRLAGVLLKGSEVQVGFSSAYGPLQDFTVRDGSLRLHGADLTVRRFSFHLKASELLRGHVHLAWADVDGLRIVLHPGVPREAGAPGSRKRGERAPPPPLTIDRLGFTDGIVARREPGGPLRVLARDIHGDVSLTDGRLLLRSVSAGILESTVTTHGTVDLFPPAADIRLESRGRLRAAGRLRGSPGAWRLDGSGFYGPAPWRLSAGLTGADAWTLAARVDGLPPSALPGRAPPALKPLTGSVRASGRGFEAASAEASGRLELREQGGPGVAVDARAAAGGVSWRLQGLGGLGAASTGTFRLADREVAAAGTLELPGALLTRFVPAASGALSFHLQARGPWPRPAWRLRGRADGAGFRSVRLSSAALTASGTGFTEILVAVEAWGLASGSAVLTRLDAAGTLELASGTVTTRWDRLALEGPTPLRSLRPFTTTTGSGSLRITGLELAGAGSSLRLDAARSGESWEFLRFRAAGLDTRPWAAAGLRLPLEGLVEGEADLRGSLKSMTGTLSVRVASAVYAGASVGLLRASGELTGTEARLRLELESPGGSLSASGVVPGTLNGSRLPDFDLRVKTAGYTLDPWTARSTVVRVKGVLLVCDLGVSRKSGTFSSRGSARVTGSAVTLAAAGMELKDLDLRLTGAGEAARFTGRARTGKKKHDLLESSGELRAAGPDLRLDAKHLYFDADMGASGEAEAHLRLAGAWGAPSVTGEVRIDRADFTPPKKKKKGHAAKGGTPAAPPLPARPGPGTADVAVRFERNVWFKDGDSSIEFRGDLAYKKNAYEEGRLLGTVETVRGSYGFYGRSFDIQSARVMLTEDNQADPSVGGLAQYTEPQSGTKVFLHVDGSVQHPRLELSSQPPMDQRDIISVLAFGKPLSEISGGTDQRASAAAQQVMAGYVGDSLRQTVFKRLDLDVLQIRQEPGSSQADITVGRYLTKSLFVSYGQTLGQTGQRRVNAEYTLTDHFALEGHDSSEGKYVMDFLFKFGYP